MADAVIQKRNSLCMELNSLCMELIAFFAWRYFNDKGNAAHQGKPRGKLTSEDTVSIVVSPKKILTNTTCFCECLKRGYIYISKQSSSVAADW